MGKIAVVSMSCLFPGADNPEQFFQNLKEEIDSTSLAGTAEMGQDPALYFAPKKGVPDKLYSLRGGYIRGFEFDSSGFRLPPEQLSKLDPIYQWPLYAAKEALQAAGYLDHPALARCGLVLGNLSFPTRASNQVFLPLYYQKIEEEIQKTLHCSHFSLGQEEKEHTKDDGWVSSRPAKVVARALGLKGGHFALDGACASSLYAMKLACDRLDAGQVDLMLAGAVSGADPFFIAQGFSTFQAFSEQDQSCPLDQNSQGLVAAEGASFFLLKRLEEAQQAGDPILSVITGIGLSNDGRGKFILSPNPAGQVLSYERAYAEQAVDPAQVGYVECHATGTPLGDVTELDSLGRFFGEKDLQPKIGSVKSNFGHMLTAAGMGSMMKVILSMREGFIPATIRIKNPLESPANSLGKNQIVQSKTPWPSNKPIGAVNAFGFGGTNAHILFEKPERAQAEKSRPFELCKLAIVGLEAAYGPLSDLQEFSQALYAGEDLTSTPSPQRQRGLALDQGQRGGYMESFDFDYLRFKIPPNEKDPLIPQQLLLLKTADAAIRQAGLREGENAGVIVAMEADSSLHAFRARIELGWRIKEGLRQAGVRLEPEEEAVLIEHYQNQLHNPVGVNQFTSFIGNIMACRVSNLWDFKGASFTLSVEEHSTLQALDTAHLILSKGEVTAMVIAAVDLCGSAEFARLQGAQWSEEARFLFDPDYSGPRPADGAAALVVMDLREAKRRKIPIYAEITSLNRLDPAEEFTPQADYLEFCGTQPQPITLQGERHSVLASSLETQGGQAYAAQEALSLAKLSLAIYHRFIPPLVNFKGFPTGPLTEGPLAFEAQARPWLNFQQRKGQLLSLGEESWALELTEGPREVVFPPEPLQRPPYLFWLKGKDLPQGLASLSEAAAKRPLFQVAKDCYAQAFKAEGASLALIAGSLEELRQEIHAAKKAVEQGEALYSSPRGSFYTSSPLGEKGKVAFVYPGGFNSYPGLHRDLLYAFPQLWDVTASHTPEPENLFWAGRIFPKTAQLPAEALEKAWQEDLTQDAVGMFETGIHSSILLTDLFQGFFQIKPDLAFGYSMGEVSMAHALRLWPSTHKMSRYLKENPIFQTRLAGPKEVAKEAWGVEQVDWVGYAVQTDVDALRKKVFGLEKLYLILINSPKEAVLAGERKNLEDFLIQEGLAGHPVPLSDVIHCDLVRSEYESLIRLHSIETPHPPEVTFFSAATYGVTEVTQEQIASNIAEMYCRALDFPKLVEATYQAGARIFIELGPRSSCGKWINQTLQERPHVAVGVNQKGQPDQLSIYKALAQLIGHGLQPNLGAIFGEDDQQQAEKKKLVQRVLTGGKVIQPFVLKKKPLAPPQLQEPSLPRAPTPAQAVAASPQPNTAILGEETTPLDRLFALHLGLAQTQAAFLEMRRQSLHQLKGLLRYGQLLETQQEPSSFPVPQPTAPPADELPRRVPGHLAYPPVSHPGPKPQAIWDEAALMEFACGSIAEVFGPEYAVIDSYGPRVRLPMPPYLLVNRVTALEAKKGEFKQSSITTEYDVPHDAWFCVDGQIPWAIAVEAGQCDLLLISYLGIDFEAKGKYLYRLLDCTLTFKGKMPKEGDRMRYEIQINSFARHGHNLLFFFEYQCFVGDELVHIMTDGCAGFFSLEDLEKGKGVLKTDKEKAERAKVKKQAFQPLLQTNKTAFTHAEILCLCRGQIASCFGPAFDQQGLNPALRFSSEEFLMLDQISSIDPQGGLWGLGQVTAFKDLTPEDWYFPCHFKDDPCLAGSLMAEGCVQLLEFYLLYLGMQSQTKKARFQPIAGLANKVRCRGQVGPRDHRLEYRMEVVEIGLSPHPYAKANVDILLKGKVVVDFQGVGIELLEDEPASILQHQLGHGEQRARGFASDRVSVEEK